MKDVAKCRKRLIYLKKTPNSGDEGHLPCVFQPLSQNEVHSSWKLKNSPHLFRNFLFTCVSVESCLHPYVFGDRHEGRAVEEPSFFLHAASLQTLSTLHLCTLYE